MFILYEVTDDFSLDTISGKSQYGDLKHAQKRAKTDNKGKKITWRRDTRIPGPKRYYGYNKQGELINAVFEHPNKPKRKTNMAKKKRSAKQLANDKRLGRMAKARAKANRGGRRKTVRKKTRRKVARKKNVHATRRRTSLKKSHLWRVFRCRGKSVFWILMDSNGKWNWTKKTGKAILFATREAAGTVARGIAKKRGYAPYQLGAAPREMSASQIAAECKQGK